MQFAHTDGMRSVKANAHSATHSNTAQTLAKDVLDQDFLQTVVVGVLQSHRAHGR
jgi:hypothetical protein